MEDDIIKTKTELLSRTESKENENYITKDDVGIILEEYLEQNQIKMEERILAAVQAELDRAEKEAQKYAEEAKAARDEVIKMESSKPFWWNIRG